MANSIRQPNGMVTAGKRRNGTLETVAAEKPYRLIDRRSSSGYRNDFHEAVSSARAAANPTRPKADVDSRLLTSSYTRKSLLSLSRWLCANCSVLRGAIDEMVTYATSSIMPQFDGTDTAWGNQAEEWLYNHDNIIDVRGDGYNRATWLRSTANAVIRDGDIATLLTETEDGYPQIQVIPGHRIGCRTEGELKDGPFAGNGHFIFDGVILNRVGTTVGYRVLGETAEQDKDYAASDVIFQYKRGEYPDQVRGISQLGASLIDWDDVSTARKYELTAQKAAASVALIENNETGEADPTALYPSGEGQTINSDGSANPLAVESYEGGQVRYFRANSGAGLQAFRNDRPTQNQQAFEESIIRSALQSIGWSFDFSHNPTKAGGAQMRVVVEKINRMLCYFRETVIYPAHRRLDGWRISKAMKLGLLPWSDEWFMWKYQGPANLTADEKYSSDVALQEMRVGLTSPQKESAKRGEWWEDNYRNAARARRRFEDICKEEKVDPDKVILLTPNGNPPTSAQQSKPEQQQD